MPRAACGKRGGRLPCRRIKILQFHPVVPAGPMRAGAGEACFLKTACILHRVGRAVCANAPDGGRDVEA